MKRKIYISGPMTEIKNLNRESFKNAYLKLIEVDVKVINPHDIGDMLHLPKWIPGKISWFIYIFFDVLALILCNEIYMLEGWESSSGANVELKVAKFLKMKEVYEDLGLPFDLRCLSCCERYDGYFNNDT